MRSVVRVHLGPPKEDIGENGGIAQLGEHLLCKQGVIGSIPIISTIEDKYEGLRDWVFIFGFEWDQRTHLEN